MSKKKIERRKWQCPSCERRYNIPVTAKDPGTCPKCADPSTKDRPRTSQHKSLIAAGVTAPITLVVYIGYCQAIGVTWPQGFWTGVLEVFFLFVMTSFIYFEVHRRL